jgi:hypothetical protein
VSRDVATILGGEPARGDRVALSHRRRHPPPPEVAAALARAQRGVVLDDDEALLLFDTTGVELEALARAADEVRAERVGDTVTYVVNRNLNFTNVCYTGCRFCAFAQRRGCTVPSRGTDGNVARFAGVIPPGDRDDSRHGLTTIAGWWSAERRQKLPYGRFPHHSAEPDGPLRRGRILAFKPGLVAEFYTSAKLTGIVRNEGAVGSIIRSPPPREPPPCCTRGRFSRSSGGAVRYAASLVPRVTRYSAVNSTWGPSVLSSRSKSEARSSRNAGQRPSASAIRRAAASGPNRVV